MSNNKTRLQQQVIHRYRTMIPFYDSETSKKDSRELLNLFVSEKSVPGVKGVLLIKTLSVSTIKKALDKSKSDKISQLLQAELKRRTRHKVAVEPSLTRVLQLKKLEFFRKYNHPRMRKIPKRKRSSS